MIPLLMFLVVCLALMLSMGILILEIAIFQNRMKCFNKMQVIWVTGVYLAG